MKITHRVLGDIALMNIGYNFNYHKVLRFIHTKGARSTDPDDTYLSRFPEDYSNVYIQRFFCPCMLVSYLNACNTIYNYENM